MDGKLGFAVIVGEPTGLRVVPAHKGQFYLRISRSVIVNIHQIRELQPVFKGETLVVLKSGKSYPTTRPIREIQQKLEFR